MKYLQENAIKWSRPKDHATEYKAEFLIYWFLFLLFGCTAVYISQAGLTFLLEDEF